MPDLIVIERPEAGGYLVFSRKELECVTQKGYEEEIRRILSKVREYEETYQTVIPVVVAGGIYDCETGLI